MISFSNTDLPNLEQLSKTTHLKAGWWNL